MAVPRGKSPARGAEPLTAPSRTGHLLSVSHMFLLRDLNLASFPSKVSCSPCKQRASHKREKTPHKPSRARWSSLPVHIRAAPPGCAGAAGAGGEGLAAPRQHSSQLPGTVGNAERRRSTTRVGQEFPWTRLLEGKGMLGSQGCTSAIRLTPVTHQRLRRGTARHSSVRPLRPRSTQGARWREGFPHGKTFSKSAGPTGKRCSFVTAEGKPTKPKTCQAV